MSDAVIIGLSTLVCGLITTIFSGSMAYFLARLDKKGEAAARVLAATTKVADEKLDDIHTLVNANMGAQLKISAIALRRVAALTKHSDDIAAADTAEKLLREHEGKQAIVDKKEAL